MIGEPDAGNPHVRFDEGRQETCVSRGAPVSYATVRALYQPERLSRFGRNQLTWFGALVA
jgi:hypothetical protein